MGPDNMIRHDVPHNIVIFYVAGLFNLENDVNLFLHKSKTSCLLYIGPFFGTQP
jgi:hypothetical protein